MRSATKTGHAAKIAPMQLSAAYGVCRHITRTSAKNFYYGFLVLPRAKRDAICAVYAFMRHADDISDDPQLPENEKRTRLEQWLDGMHHVIDGGATDDPVLMALADTSRRFDIPVTLLDKLVEGTAMDIAPAGISGSTDSKTTAPQVLFRSFDELYHYCYHVASVVGLVSIRIFGYSDPSAERLAERTGIAFQLTNIIRDVKEDASFGRIYLPEADLLQFGISTQAFQNGGASSNLRPLLAMEAERAREFYRSATELLPMISKDSQPALWTLVEIYRRLLDKITARNFDVLAEGKIRLSRAEKLSVLSKGLWQRLAS
ncbi:MAG: phytoene/squalene synthase family protein [Candidatus Korobacteraceae bacterium]